MSDGRLKTIFFSRFRAEYAYVLFCGSLYLAPLRRQFSVR